jgi:DNA-binding HxlR family transcriptional regulator/CheY-like chemotaxis protein
MRRSEAKYNSPIEITLKVIGGKWKCVILWWLRQETKRFSELKQLMPGITHKVLVQQLRELETDGLIRRKAYREDPPRIEYSLTPYGETIRPITELMGHWGKAHQPEYRSSLMPLNSLCVLVVKPQVEDDRLLESLEAYGFWTIAVAPGVAIAKLDQIQPDVVIVDTDFVEDGLTLLNQIKVVENTQNRKILAIALTATQPATQPENILLQNFQLCLTKPVQPAEVIAAIANLPINPTEG